MARSRTVWSQLDGRAQHLAGHGAPGDGDCLHERSRDLGQLGHAPPQNIVEGDPALEGAPRGLLEQVADELGEEHGMSFDLAPQRVVLTRQLSGLAGHGRDELADLHLGEGLEGDAGDLEICRQLVQRGHHRALRAIAGLVV